MRLLRLILIGFVLWLGAAGAALAQCGTTAPANKFCGNDTGSSALAGWKSIPASALSAIGGGMVLANPTGASAVPVGTIAPVLGIPGTSQGQVGFAGATSGTAVLRGQPAAGTPVLLLPNTSGTLAASASLPVVLNAVTGALTCPTCVTSSGGGAITGTAPISVSAAGVVSINAPYVSLTASNGGIVYSGATDLAILSGTATARQMLQSGSSAAPAWSTAVWPATTTINQLLYSDAANNVTGLTTANGGVLNTGATGVPSITATPLLGVAGTSMGTLRLSGSTSGVITITPQATAGTATVTLPNASGTVAVSASLPVVLSATTGALTCPTCVTSSGGGAITGTAPISVSAAGVVSITSPLPLTNGGTAASLTASNGGIVYSTGSALAILSGTATANRHLASGASGAPSWTTATFPATAAAGTMLAAGTSNVISATATPTLGANGGTGGQITFNGSTSGSAVLRVAAAAGTATFQLPTTNGASGDVLSTNGSGVTSWIASSGTGTVTSVTAGAGLTATSNPITTTGTLSSYFDPGSITNCILTVSYPGNALTLELKTQSGATPSASAPCTISFGGSTLATGDYTPVNVTAATTFATGATGSTFGVAANVPFRLWVTALNNAGTVVLGVSNQTGSLDIYPLEETVLQSTTACSACTNATSAGTIYTTAAQSSKAMRILGFLEWSSGLGTPGTWNSANTSMRLMGPGVKKPGDTVQRSFMSTTSTTNTATTSIVASAVAKNITKTSAANPVRLDLVGYAVNNSGSTGGFTTRFYRGSAACTTAIGILGFGTILANNTGNMTLQWVDMPAASGTTAANYTVCISSPNSLSMNFPYASSGATLILEEIMG